MDQGGLMLVLAHVDTTPQTNIIRSICAELFTVSVIMCALTHVLVHDYPRKQIETCGFFAVVSSFWCAQVCKWCRLHLNLSDYNLNNCRVSRRTNNVFKPYNFRHMYLVGGFCVDANSIRDASNGAGRLYGSIDKLENMEMLFSQELGIRIWFSFQHLFDLFQTAICYLSNIQAKICWFSYI